MSFSEDQIRRYSRHLLLKEVGGKGQRKLLDSSAFVLGAGGLGCPAALYLAAAGVGRITIADSDSIDVSNLQRQILYGTGDVGKAKAATAAEALRRLNPDVRVVPLTHRVNAADARELFRGHDVVLEGSDSPETKFAANDAAVAERIPFVVGGVVRWSGQLLVVKESACYRCVFEAPPTGEFETCEAAGVLGAAAGVVGAAMAVEAIRILLGVGETGAGKMKTWNFLKGTERVAAWKRRKDCPTCV